MPTPRNTSVSRLHYATAEQKSSQFRNYSPSRGSKLTRLASLSKRDQFITDHWFSSSFDYVSLFVWPYSVDGEDQLWSHLLDGYPGLLPAERPYLQMYANRPVPMRSICELQIFCLVVLYSTLSSHIFNCFPMYMVSPHGHGVTEASDH